MNAVRAEVRKLLTLPALALTALLTAAAALLLGRPGVPVTQAGFLILGVLAATHEHQGGGQFRTTLLAVPGRLRLAAAKGVALVLVTTPLAVLVRPVAYLVGTTVLAAAAGSLIRHAVPAVGLLLAGYLIAGPVLRGWCPASAAWLPDTALTDPARGAAAAAGWTLGAVVGATVVLRRRDA